MVSCGLIAHAKAYGPGLENRGRDAGWDQGPASCVRPALGWRCALSSDGQPHLAHTGHCPSDEASEKGLVQSFCVSSLRHKLNLQPD